ncbi:PREDICTED: aminopeptidase N-like [Habropoda laboriosa]|uniref:aminopeptidase N-like n=1 Tax=Habropoda laboriosa TaxID=597456 RepID=UPI00083E5742|nr:PREDICTED: aminopeptidase N-like [Habropoda laboriosa]
MSRGSISSWQDYGRRSSQSMPQFSGGPVQFMISDDIECKRGDGWFLSYTKIAGIVAVFIIGVIAAGFLGWYIDSLPKKKPYETLDLLNDEIETTDIVGESFISPFIHPLKYRLELTPFIDINGPSILKGRVVIDFRVNDTTGLNKLFLNAKNIVVASYKLSLLDSGENKSRLRRKRRRRADDNINYNSYQDDAVLVSRALYSVENNVVVTLAENETVQYEGDDEQPAENMSSPGGSTISSISYGSSSDLDEVRGLNANIKESVVKPSAAFSENVSSRIPITQYNVDDDREVHTIHLGTWIHQGVYLLEIEYQALIDENAFFIANYSASGKQKWLMGTKLKHSGARYLFPVFDDTKHKSIFSLSVTHPEEMRVLSNMPLRSLWDDSNTSVVDTFDVSPPLSPHNLVFLMGHIELVDTILIEDTEVVAELWFESDRRSQEIYLFDKLSRVINNLIDVFSIPYPLPKLHLVCLPPGIDENMGSPGLIAVKQSLFYASNKSPLVTKNNALRVLVGLMVQQWIDEFTNVNRTEAWMLEGSLIYFQHEIVGEIDSSLDSSGSFIVDVLLQAMEIDEYSISRPLLENVNYRLLQPFNEEHAKGACLIRMLHGAISDTAFRNGYKKLITRWKYNSTDVADFMNILEAEAAEHLLGVSLEEMINSWISQGGYPLVTVKRNYEEESAVIYQEPFALDRPSESISKFWHIPLNYINENGNWSSPTKVWFQSEPKIILENIASNESWVLFNVNKTGYYRVHYDERNWMLLKTALTENHELFPAETRASLIEDVFSLATVGLVKYETVFDFIKYMQMKERHYLPWSTFMRHMFKLNSLLYETSVFNDFQEFVVRFVSPLYNEVKSKIDEGSQLTMLAIKLACMFEHTECLDWTRNIFENAKTDNEIQEIIPSYIRSTFYCTVARYGTRREWSYFTEKVALTEDEEERKRLLSSFACFQAPWVLQFILNEILHEDRFREDEILVILNAFPRNPAATQVASRFVRANWQEIVQRYSGSYTVLKTFILSMINGLTTDQDLEDLQIFRENNYDSMKGTRYAAALVEANGIFMASWLKNSLPQIENILKDEVVENASFS